MVIAKDPSASEKPVINWGFNWGNVSNLFVFVFFIVFFIFIVFEGLRTKGPLICPHSRPNRIERKPKTIETYIFHDSALPELKCFNT
jgi:hypothetical protein